MGDVSWSLLGLEMVAVLPCPEVVNVAGVLLKGLIGNAPGEKWGSMEIGEGKRHATSVCNRYGNVHV